MRRVVPFASVTASATPAHGRRTPVARGARQRSARQEAQQEGCTYRHSEGRHPSYGHAPRNRSPVPHAPHMPRALIYDLTMAYTRREESGCTQRAARACCREHVSPRGPRLMCVSGVARALQQCNTARADAGGAPRAPRTLFRLRVISCDTRGVALGVHSCGLAAVGGLPALSLPREPGRAVLLLRAPPRAAGAARGSTRRSRGVP